MFIAARDDVGIYFICTADVRYGATHLAKDAHLRSGPSGGGSVLYIKIRVLDPKGLRYLELIGGYGLLVWN